jgi:anti-anti-sigma factor
MEMTLTELDDHTSCVRLVGKLDAPGVDRIDTRFTAAVAARGRHAIIDMSGVTLLTSMGIRLLISTARALSQKGAKMVLFGAQPLVQEGLNHTALDQIIAVAETEAEAHEKAVA